MIQSQVPLENFIDSEIYFSKSITRPGDNKQTGTSGDLYANNILPKQQADNYFDRFYAQVYPNPSKDGFITVTWNLEEAVRCYFEVYNCTGMRIYNEKVEVQSSGFQRMQIDMSVLPGGMYFIRIFNGKDSFTDKLLLEK